MGEKKSYKVAIDDNILMKDVISTAGSKILANFTPPFNAAVIDKIRAAGMEIAGRCIPNEFGVSLTDPFGSVCAVANGQADIGLACDVHGAVRSRAAENGVCFIKPTYGMVSRFGLVSTAPSMEQIGVCCHRMEDGFDALAAIAGFDERDGAVAETERYTFDAGDEGVSGLRVAVFDVFSEDMGPVCEMLKKSGAQVETVHFPLLPAASAAAYIILCAETGGSIARYDGIKFGFRSERGMALEDVYMNTRSECFTPETKLLALMGMYVLTKEQFSVLFDQSLKVRRLIQESVNGLLSTYDCIAMPAGMKNTAVSGGGDAFCAAYENLRYTALPNLTGMPAAAASFETDALYGVQFMAKAFEENKLFAAGKWFQNAAKEASR